MKLGTPSMNHRNDLDEFIMRLFEIISLILFGMPTSRILLIHSRILFFWVA